MMNEKLISFIWQFQYFEKSHLQTDEGIPLSVLKTGILNTDAGPDFSGTHLMLNDIEWIGDVEIHVNASDWYKHQHPSNPAYESVVLHVVWNNDQDIIRKDGTIIPTLTLKNLVRKSILEQYEILIQSKFTIPCGSQFTAVEDIEKFNMLDRVLVERMKTKAENVLALWMINKSDWEETAYQLLGQHFGFKLNDVSFLRLCQKIPRKVILQQHGNLFKIEALLYGSAGLIPPLATDEYTTQLFNEYTYLAKKYKLPSPLLESEWKFLRLRPAGFPTIRLAQFAKILSNQEKLFNVFINAQHIDELHAQFRVEQSAYWKQHFLFGKETVNPTPKIGKDASNNLIINVVIPILFAYSKSRNLPEYQDKAIHFLSELPGENNRITRLWRELGLKIETAGDSQGAIQWYNAYCSKKQCLYCNIGAKLIKT